MVSKVERNNLIFNKKLDKIVEGVSVVVKDTEGNLFFVLEKEEKAWKKPGQWSVMMETIEKRDKTLDDVIRRGLEEELGINTNAGEKIFSKNLTLEVYVRDSKKDKIYLARIYVYEVILTDDQTQFAKNFTNGEIGKVKLANIDEFIKGKIRPLRPGTVESILGLKDVFYVQDGEYFKF